MRVVHARNVSDAYRRGMELLMTQGVYQASRAGQVLVVPCPVTTVYQQPAERVLLDPARDANPFFHLMESLWMLAGEDDGRWLDRFVHDFSERFSEPGEDGRVHGAYGYRWREHFSRDGTQAPLDQLEKIVELLRRNPDDRRVVLQMWDPETDLGTPARDVPCNVTALPRVHGGALDLTVFCRSNDAVWGAYGANAVHFSVLQEYLAGRIGTKIGTLYQVSNNLHVYTATIPTVSPAPVNPYETMSPLPMGADWEQWDADLRTFMAWTWHWIGSPDGQPDQDALTYRNQWFATVASPMFAAHHLWKRKLYASARAVAATVEAEDWRRAAVEWLDRRSAARSAAATAAPSDPLTKNEAHALMYGGGRVAGKTLEAEKKS